MPYTYINLLLLLGVISNFISIGYEPFVRQGSSSKMRFSSRRYRRYLRGHRRRPRGSPPVFLIPLLGTPVEAFGQSCPLLIVLVYIPLDAAVTRVTWSLATRSPRTYQRSSTCPETYFMLTTISMANGATGAASTIRSATTSAACSASRA